MKINWEKVWNDLDKWFNKNGEKCGECGHVDYFDPEWKEQTEKIETLVNAQIKDKK